ELAGEDCRASPPDPHPVAPGHTSACLRPWDEVRRLAATPAQADPSQARPSPEADTPATPPISPIPPQAGDPPPIPSPEAAPPIPPQADRPPPTAAAAPPPAAPPPAIAATGVVRRYSAGRGTRRGTLVALRGVGLTVAPGESVAVVGESGSGKSTLLRAIAGLEKPDLGVIQLGSAGAQMVFQDAGASLTPWCTVGELIGERLRGAGVPRGERAQRVRSALAAVGLPTEVVGARAAQLSGGQRQRVALARATVVPPEVLLCDEPTSALDVSLAAAVLNLIAALRAELGMAVVFVTHDLAVARVVADRIAVMYLGRIVELGTADEITHDPRHPYTQTLVAAVPDVGTRPPAVGGEPASPLDPPPGCAFNPRCPRADAACADPDLVPPLSLVPGAAARLAACIRLGGS
ncbi:MAG TPA: oligopeptide/dipeptide ABC transporter ATP-binding protein, partial [Pseudonocardia sp.]